MQTEQIIDIFKIVRLLRAVRPQFIDQVNYIDQIKNLLFSVSFFFIKDQYENLYLSIRDYAQQYLNTITSQRTIENSFYINTSVQDQLSTNNRIIQRL